MKSRRHELNRFVQAKHNEANLIQKIASPVPKKYKDKIIEISNQGERIHVPLSPSISVQNQNSSLPKLPHSETRNVVGSPSKTLNFTTNSLPSQSKKLKLKNQSKIILKIKFYFQS